MCRCALHTPGSPPCSDCPTHRTRHPTSEIHPPVTAPPTSSLAWGVVPQEHTTSRTLPQATTHTRLSSTLTTTQPTSFPRGEKQHIWKHVPTFLQATAVPLRPLRRPPQNNRPLPTKMARTGTSTGQILAMTPASSTVGGKPEPHQRVEDDLQFSLIFPQPLFPPIPLHTWNITAYPHTPTGPGGRHHHPNYSCLPWVSCPLGGAGPHSPVDVSPGPCEGRRASLGPWQGQVGALTAAGLPSHARGLADANH